MPKTDVVKKSKKDEEVVDLLGNLNSLKKSIKELENLPWQAGTTLDEVGNIREITDLTQLKRVAGSIIARASFEELGAVAVGETTKEPFTLNGYTKDQWLTDIKRQYQLAKEKSDIKDLEELIKEGEKFLTEAYHKEVFMKKAKAKLNKMNLGSAGTIAIEGE